MRTLICLMTLGITASIGAAGELKFSYENFQMTPTGAAELVLKFTNHTGTHLSYAVARCALLGDDGRAITTMAVIARDVPAGSVAYAKNYGPRDKRIKHADCRIEP